MNWHSLKQAYYTSSIAKYVSSHKVSLGLLLGAYGTFYLSSVVMSGWNVFDWGESLTSYPTFAINPLLPRSSIAPIFFFTSIPALLLGTIMLVTYSLKGLSDVTVEDRERVAFILVAFGLFYVIVGAWPLGNQVNFPWDWQKQIISNGPLFSWGLYILSLIVLLVGSISVYRCSKIYHRGHPTFSLES